MPELSSEMDITSRQRNLHAWWTCTEGERVWNQVAHCIQGGDETYLNSGKWGVDWWIREVRL